MNSQGNQKVDINITLLHGYFINIKSYSTETLRTLRSIS